MPTGDAELLAAVSRTQARIRELESLVAMLAVRHGQNVGPGPQGTRQIRIPEEEAFALRAQLPARDVAVMVTFEEGDFLITCI